MSRGWSTEGAVGHVADVLADMTRGRGGRFVIRLTLAWPPGWTATNASDIQRLAWRPGDGMRREALGVAATCPRTQLALQRDAAGELVPDPAQLSELADFPGRMRTSVDCAVQADFPVLTPDGATVQVRAWLPRLWLTELPIGGVDLAVVIDRRVPDAAMIAELQHLLGRVLWPQPVVESAWRLAPPTAEWPRALAQAVSRLDGTHLTKVVLARCAHLQLAVSTDEARWSWYGCLLHRRPDACVVDVNIPEQVSFLCASPERLVRCRGSAVAALALAGTTAMRDAAPVDAKLTREHACVRDWILGTLVSAGVDMVPPDQPTLRDAGSLVHLATPLHGRRPDGLGTLALALRLHPTPALLGLPRADALTVVTELESQPRVWYGGFVGVLAGDRTGDGEVVVVLRGVGQAGPADPAWAAWAGAGLVPGSNPTAEAEEIERKLAAICDSLTDAAQVHRETCR